MPDRTYHIKASSVTTGMESRASEIIEVKVLKVLSENVASFEDDLPEDTELYMSSDTADVTEANGFQDDGILLPKKAGG